MSDMWETRATEAVPLSAAGTPGGELPASEKEVIRPPYEDEKPDVAVPGGTVITTIEVEPTDESSVNSVGSVNNESSLSNGPAEGKEYTTNKRGADTGETAMNIRGETGTDANTTDSKEVTQNQVPSRPLTRAAKLRAEKAEQRLVSTVVDLGALSKTTAGTDDEPKNMTTPGVSAMTGKNDVVRQCQIQRDRGDEQQRARATTGQWQKMSTARSHGKKGDQHER
ncbi:hypothetical protein Pcac1_g8166 [Phytophthora cactorum]|nr:hypothetical protein Pcac1_g8166 [Phytophthora cactorum]